MGTPWQRPCIGGILQCSPEMGRFNRAIPLLVSGRGDGRPRGAPGRRRYRAGVLLGVAPRPAATPLVMQPAAVAGPLNPLQGWRSSGRGATACCAAASEVQRALSQSVR